MEYQLMRGTGIKVSRVYLGTMTFGGKPAPGRGRALDQQTLEACDAVWQRLRGDHFGYNR